MTRHEFYKKGDENQREPCSRFQEKRTPRVGKKCQVVGGYHRYGKDKYRFMRPETRKVQEEKDMLEKAARIPETQN